MNKDNLRAAGINVDEALDRFMGNERMLNKFLLKFLNDGNYAKLREAVDEGSADKMLEASHTLKGVCGNLAFTELFKLFDRQVKAIREGDLQAAGDLMCTIAEEYEKVTSAIESNCQ